MGWISYKREGKGSRRKGVNQTKGKEMKAYIVHNSPLGTDHWGEGRYSLITENEKIIYERWCSNRAFANSDLTRGIQKILEDSGVTEVFSNGVVVWQNGKITDGADKAFRSANYEYERLNSDAR